MKKLLLISTLLLSGLLPMYAQSNEQVLTLDWIDLIPENERNQFNADGMPALNHDGEMTAAQSKIGGVRKELNGSVVKIPGFVIPLEGDANNVTEFLLVPYFGACIHVPPPPPNQIIFVSGAKNLKADMIYSPFWISGTLTTEVMTHDLGQSAYSIKADTIEEYTY